MEIFFLTYITIFIFGTFIGSFLNVLILRHNTGKTLLGRSGCMSCRKPLSWYELVPVLSFLSQRGRCRKCRSEISTQYPIVELMAGVLFVLAFFISATVPELVFNVLLFSVLLIITVYDLRHKIIPDRYVWIFVGLGSLLLFVDLSTLTFGLPTLSELLAPLIVASPLLALWFLSKGMWIGFGDSKVALGMGALLGIQGGVVALMLAFWIGAVYGISVILTQKLYTAMLLNKRGRTLTMKSEVPFAPFLLLGFLLVYAFPEIFFEPLRALYFPF